MKTIYRYELTKPINDIKLPLGAKILNVGLSKELDKEIISIWFAIDTDISFETRRFLVFGTGANMDDTTNFDISYIGTVQKKNMYAFHVFEAK